MWALTSIGGSSVSLLILLLLLLLILLLLLLLLLLPPPPKIIIIVYYIYKKCHTVACTVHVYQVTVYKLPQPNAHTKTVCPHSDFFGGQSPPLSGKTTPRTKAPLFQTVCLVKHTSLYFASPFDAQSTYVTNSYECQNCKITQLVQGFKYFVWFRYVYINIYIYIYIYIYIVYMLSKQNTIFQTLARRLVQR